MARVFRQKTGDAAREQISNGVKIIADQVGSTLGPNGSLVAIRVFNPNSPTNHTTMLTKDGVSVAKAVQGESPGENIGVDIVREASLLTLKNAGDGTTSTVIIAEQIYNLVCIALGYVPANLQAEIESGNSSNPRAIKQEVLDAMNKYVAELGNIAIPVNAENDLLNIARVSTNGDEKIAELIVRAFKAVQYKGHVSYAQSELNEVEVVPGCRATMNMISPAMITNLSEGTAEYENPIICIHEGPTTSAEGVQKLVSIGRSNMSTGRYSPVVYISQEISGSTIGALVGNHLAWYKSGNKEGLPMVGMEYRINREVMEDIAFACDTIMIGNNSGKKVDNMGSQMFGTCAKIVVNRDYTTFYFNQNERLRERIEYLEAELQRETDSDLIAALKQRISNLTVGVAIIKVKANSQTEAGEKFDRIDDAVRAVQCALEEGIVCGGGIGYIDAIPEDLANTIGGKILMMAVSKLACLIDNIESLPQDREDYLRQYYLERGIMDPAKVIRLAVINGVTAGLHLALTGGYLSHSEI